MINSNIGFNGYDTQVLKELKSSRPFFDKDDALASLFEDIINVALKGEMDAYLSEMPRQVGNRHNGKM